MSKQLSGQRPPVKQAQRRERREEMRRRDQAQVAANQKRKVIIAIIAGFLVLGGIIGAIALFGGFSSSSPCLFCLF